MGLIILYVLLGTLTFLILRNDDTVNLTDGPIEVVLFWPGFLILYVSIVIYDVLRKG